jgi:hypothetical protein
MLPTSNVYTPYGYGKIDPKEYRQLLDSFNPPQPKTKPIIEEKKISEEENKTVEVDKESEPKPAEEEIKVAEIEVEKEDKPSVEENIDDKIEETLALEKEVK